MARHEKQTVAVLRERFRRFGTYAVICPDANVALIWLSVMRAMSVTTTSDRWLSSTGRSHRLPPA